jgi:flagellar export protein FliJ
MARFVFRLESVLRQRRRVERQGQRELAEQAAAAAVLHGQLQQMDRDFKLTLDDLRRNRLTGRLDLAFLAAHRRYSAAMQRKAMDLARDIAVAEKRVETARQALMQAAVARKTLEKLRENRLLAWNEDLARRQTAEFDDMGMQIAFTDLQSAMEP